jgi:hypothetical protein
MIIVDKNFNNYNEAARFFCSYIKDIAIRLCSTTYKNAFV